MLNALWYNVTVALLSSLTVAVIPKRGELSNWEAVVRIFFDTRGLDLPPP